MEKVVSGQRHNDPMWFFHRSHFILFAKNRKPTFGINIKTCACVRFFLALHPDQQHPAAEGAAGEDVWSHGWKRCERLFSTCKQPKLRLFNYSDIVPNASISAMCYYYPITQPPVNPNSWVSLCVFLWHFSCVLKLVISWKTCKSNSTMSWMISAGSLLSGGNTLTHIHMQMNATDAVS